LRFIAAAAHLASHLTIGVTMPYQAANDDGGGARSQSLANPFPFWLRKQCIHAATTDANLPAHNVDIVPLPLEANSLRSVLPPDSTVFTTDVEEWSHRKEQIIVNSGFQVRRLKLGPKRMAATQIRDKIVRDDRSWHNMVSPSVVTQYGEILEQHLRTSTLTTELT